MIYQLFITIEASQAIVLPEKTSIPAFLIESGAFSWSKLISL